MTKCLITSLAVALAALVLSTSCVTRKTSTPGKSEGEPFPAQSVAIPGFESLGSPQARRKTDVLARFGRPANVENFKDRYSIMAYPVSGWDEKLLILFWGEDLLGFARESSRAVLDSTIEHHARTAGGTVVVFQAWANGETRYFRTEAEILERQPRRTGGSSVPLLEARAVELASEWLKRYKPGSPIQPVIQGMHEVPRLPGAVFYVIAIPQFAAGKMAMENLVILMDGTILTGEPEAKP